MPNDQMISQKKSKKQKSQPKLLGAVALGALGGVFIGLLAMAISILVLGILRLIFPDMTFQLVGLNVTAVIFVIFFALGWLGGAMILWYKLPPFPSDSKL